MKGWYIMISFIVAMDKNRVIGNKNRLPWHLPADLQYFKRVTMGHPVIMGRKTYESIGRPLPGRENIILTRDENYTVDGCTVLHSVSDIKELEKQNNDELFVIGGAEIFKETFTIANRLYITMIEEEFEGDTYFPNFDKNEWVLVSKEKGPRDEKNPYNYYFLVYEHKNN
jgi:dihydrofolate reductase